MSAGTLLATVFGAIRIRRNDLIKQNDLLVEQNLKLQRRLQLQEQSVAQKVDQVAAEISPENGARLRELLDDARTQIHAIDQRTVREHRSNTQWLERIESSAQLNRQEIMQVRSSLDQQLSRIDTTLQKLLEKSNKS